MRNKVPPIFGNSHMLDSDSLKYVDLRSSYTEAAGACEKSSQWQHALEVRAFSGLCAFGLEVSGIQGFGCFRAYLGLRSVTPSEE